MTSDVLVLNADWTIDEIVSWQKAVGLLLAEKVYMAAQYADRLIRSTSLVLPFPAVLVRKKFVQRRKVRLRRPAVLARDAYTCQYCGVQPRRPSGNPEKAALTVDHVVPKAQAVNGWVRLPWDGNRKVRAHCWENVLTACISCNSDKADRTPAQAGMTMRRVPRHPTPDDIAVMKSFSRNIPDEWKDYI